jgi:hypothetical protein
MKTATKAGARTIECASHVLGSGGGHHAQQHRER